MFKTSSNLNSPSLDVDSFLEAMTCLEQGFGRPYSWKNCTCLPEWHLKKGSNQDNDHSHFRLSSTMTIIQNTSKQKHVVLLAAVILACIHNMWYLTCHQPSWDANPALLPKLHLPLARAGPVVFWGAALIGKWLIIIVILDHPKTSNLPQSSKKYNG